MSMDNHLYTISCPSCEASLQGYDKKGTDVFACPQCRALIRKDIKGDGGYFWAEKLKKARAEPVIPLGSEGMLEGVLYRVIAYAERMDDEHFVWSEYILLNSAEQTYAFLSEFNGHWNLLLPLDKNEVNAKEVASYLKTTFREQTYNLYSKYSASFEHARGEFYWPIYKDKHVACREYILPPHMLAKEGVGPETDYFFGTYVQPSKIKKAFGLRGVPYRIGTGVTQPFYGGIDVGYFAMGALAFTILILVLNMFITMQAKEQQVFLQTFPLTDSTSGKPVVSHPFTLTGKQSNLQIDIHAQVTNSWAEAEMTMVNESTLKETSFAVGVEYYAGYEDGESWSEGSWGKEEIICAVEPGTYHFVITPTKDPVGMPTEMTLQATWDVSSWWNALLVVIVMGVITGVLYLLELSFERKRWYNSDYSPYTYEDE